MTTSTLLAFLVSFTLAVFAHERTAYAWDPIEDLTGQRLDQHIDQGVEILTGREPDEIRDQALEDLENLPESWSNCLSRPSQCAEEQIRRIPYYAIWPIIERYRAHLFRQADGRWRRIPEDIIVAAQRYYEVSLNDVYYAENIDTIHGAAVAWHNSLFFPRSVDFYEWSDLRWLLHELEHVVQYERRGGEQEFLSEYVMRIPLEIIENQTFDVHRFHNLEEDAINKANSILEAVYSDIGSLSWLAVYSNQDDDREGFSVSYSLSGLVEDIESAWDDDYSIRDVTYSTGTWVVVYSEDACSARSGFSWASEFDEFSEYIDNRWDEGLSIVDVTYGQGVWFGIFCEDNGHQSWVTRSSIDELSEAIREHWDDGDCLFEIEHGDGFWFAAFQDGSCGNRWLWRDTHTEFLDAIDEAFEDGLYIQEIEFAETGWAGVLSRRADGDGYISNGSYDEFVDWVHDIWDQGSSLRLIVPSR